MIKVYKFISKIIMLQDIFAHSLVVFVLTFITLPMMLLVFPLHSLLQGLMTFCDSIMQIIKNETSYLIESYKKLDEVQNA